MGSVLGSVSSAQMASGRPRNRFEHRGGLRRQKSSAPTIAEEVKGKAPCASWVLQPLIGRFPVRHVHPLPSPNEQLSMPYQARDRWGRVHIPRPPRSRHLGRLMLPLRPVSCSVFVLMRWRSCPGGRGDGHTGGGFVDYQWSSGHGRKQRAKNAENKRALGGSRG